MNENQKFDQIWGFRRNADSSSDESKSNFNVGNGQEKARLVPNLVTPDNDRVSETETDNRHVQVEKKPKRARNAPKKEKKTKTEVKSKPKKDSCASSNIKKRGSNTRKKKSKFISQMTVYDDFRIFTESILDDLRVARETMFAKMRKEMDQLVNTKPRSRSKKQKVSGGNATKKPIQKPRARKPTKAKQKTELPASKGLDRPQEHVENENPKDPSSKNSILTDSCPKKPIFTNTPNPVITSSNSTLPLVSPKERKNPILTDPCAKKPIFTSAPDHIVTSSYLTLPLVSPNDNQNPILIDPCAKKPIFTSAPDQIVTSSYLTLPLVSPNDKNNPILIDPCARKPIFTSAPDQIVTSSYLTLPLVLPNDTSLKLQRGNYSGLQAEERFRSYGHNNAEPSCVGNGYPIGLNHHQRFDNANSFGIPSRGVQEFSHDGSLLGTRVINGGLRYSVGLSGHNIPNHLASSGGFRSLYPN
ncbi:hypothetical protein Hanom_Chr03g00266011 [Helianthus anomalus]